MLFAIGSQAKYRAIKATMYYLTVNLAGLAVEKLKGEWHEIFQNGGFPPVTRAFAPYMLFDEEKPRCFLPFRCEQG